ncbi:hypothetical protein [Legionella spiritensis]|uniref:SH2 domain-containing protein n=1 Tax=Legionella spiritensis TaxID=452 RepID=A0A0W0Z9C0_LEGSP|nr:hypothetical protein [Legionella spiritensis]KTD65687.1 hypothetical protein Lspi_0399 [Legionella spiritensis]SNV43500.1 Uncharacterised protein [Legionella spiritensis]
MAADEKDIFPPIYGYLSPEKAVEILKSNKADEKNSREVCLVRESSECMGLLTVSYYSTTSNSFRHIRIGLTDKGWELAPTPPSKPPRQSAHSLFTNYKEDLKQFSEDMSAFRKKATAIFSNTPELRQYSLKLYEKLESLGFERENMLVPDIKQASCAYKTLYDEFSSDEEESPENRYRTWE